MLNIYLGLPVSRIFPFSKYTTKSALSMVVCLCAIIIIVELLTLINSLIDFFICNSDLWSNELVASSKIKIFALDKKALAKIIVDLNVNDAVKELEKERQDTNLLQDS